MNAEHRIRLIRVIEKIEKNPKFSKKIGIKDKTKEKLQERRGVRVMKKKIKIGFVVLVFIVVSVCGVSFTAFHSAEKESVPLETVIRNSSDLITQKM